MHYRVLYLGFENVKRAFYKKTILAVLIGLAFLIGYSSTLFIIGESNLETNFSSNDYILYFFNDAGITGMFLNILFIIFISGMFKDNINYMYISRLNNKINVLLSYMVSIFISSIIFILFVGIILLFVGGIIKDYSGYWSEGLVDLSHESFNIDAVIKGLNPINSIVISVSTFLIGLIIIGLCYYIGYLIFKSYVGGILFNLVHLFIGALAYAFDIGWLYKIALNTNTIFVFHSLNGNGDFPSLLYSILYFFIVILLLCMLAVVVTKKYINEKL